MSIMSTNCLVVDASTAVHIVPDYYFETHKISGVTGDLKPGDLGKFYDGDFEGWGKVMVTGEADVLKKKAQDFDYPDMFYVVIVGGQKDVFDSNRLEGIEEKSEGSVVTVLMREDEGNGMYLARGKVTYKNRAQEPCFGHLDQASTVPKVVPKVLPKVSEARKQKSPVTASPPVTETGSKNQKSNKEKPESSGARSKEHTAAPLSVMVQKSRDRLMSKDPSIKLIDESTDSVNRVMQNWRDRDFHQLSDINLTQDPSHKAFNITQEQELELIMLLKSKFINYNGFISKLADVFFPEDEGVLTKYRFKFNSPQGNKSHETKDLDTDYKLGIPASNFWEVAMAVFRKDVCELDLRVLIANQVNAKGRNQKQKVAQAAGERKKKDDDGDHDQKKPSSHKSHEPVASGKKKLPDSKKSAGK